MAKSIKTNNIQELLKAKGISPDKRKASESKVVPRETSRKRLYNMALLAENDVKTEHKLVTNQIQSEHTDRKPNTKQTQTAHKLNTGHEDTNWSQTKHKENTTIIETTQTQTRHKPITNIDDVNQTQSNHKVVTDNLEAVETQTDHKPITIENTNLTQTDYKPNTKNTNRSQSDHKPDTKVITPKYTKSSQTEHKPITSQAFPALVGLQKRVLIFFFEDCKNRRSNTTQEMTVQHIADYLNIATGSIKTTVNRLTEKGFINRHVFKNGRGGWSSFEIPDHIYKDLLHHEGSGKLDTNWSQTEHKVLHKLDTKVDTQLITTPLYSSSNYLNNTITEEEIFIPKPLQDLGVSFKSFKPYLETMAPSEIQKSLDAFAFDLENGAIKSHNPLNLLFGVIKKGGVYLSSNHAEQLNREVAEALKRTQEAQEKLKAIEDAKFKEQFYEWMLGNEERVNAFIERQGPLAKNEKIRESLLMAEFRKILAQES